jgi:hypothetical protein
MNRKIKKLSLAPSIEADQHFIKKKFTLHKETFHRLTKQLKFEIFSTKINYSQRKIFQADQFIFQEKLYFT